MVNNSSEDSSSVQVSDVEQPFNVWFRNVLSGTGLGLFITGFSYFAGIDLCILGASTNTLLGTFGAAATVIVAVVFSIRSSAVIGLDDDSAMRIHQTGLIHKLVIQLLSLLVVAMAVLYTVGNFSGGGRFLHNAGSSSIALALAFALSLLGSLVMPTPKQQLAKIRVNSAKLKEIVKQAKISVGDEWDYDIQKNGGRRWVYAGLITVPALSIVIIFIMISYLAGGDPNEVPLRSGKDLSGLNGVLLIAAVLYVYFLVLTIVMTIAGFGVTKSFDWIRVVSWVAIPLICLVVAIPVVQILNEEIPYITLILTFVSAVLAISVILPWAVQKKSRPGDNKFCYFLKFSFYPRMLTFQDVYKSLKSETEQDQLSGVAHTIEEGTSTFLKEENTSAGADMAHRQMPTHSRAEDPTSTEKQSEKSLTSKDKIFLGLLALGTVSVSYLFNRTE